MARSAVVRRSCGDVRFRVWVWRTVGVRFMLRVLPSGRQLFAFHHLVCLLISPGMALFRLRCRHVTLAVWLERCGTMVGVAGFCYPLPTACGNAWYVPPCVALFAGRCSSLPWRIMPLITAVPVSGISCSLVPGILYAPAACAGCMQRMPPYKLCFFMWFMF
ncbi:hypothetical protein AVEN_102230-1 [Araneus ventricosus]|uniref:Uncharacterized protein n=1 Tax=Araneus ventricosus TaxID=182803 RepID=A0A4Y2GAK6_ARAVE|nr:hypothetical protein AVEN_102230-1 [Araneus ventricosus]